MRISTNTMYERGIAQISTIQSNQVKLQEQIATGKKFNSPKEDPIGAARALELTKSMAVNDNYANIRITAKNNLSVIETNLNSASNLLISAKSQLVGAGNGALSDQERGFAANELQNTLNGLLGLANSQDASGKYLFSGFATDDKPFDETTFNYNGNIGSVELTVASNYNMAVNFAGSEVFRDGDTFSELQDIINLLNTPITNATEEATFRAGLATALDGIENSLDSVLETRATLGGRLNELDELDKAGDALDLQYQTTLSQVQDLDYAKALSDYSKTEVMLEAAQKTFTSTVKLSLFDYI